MVCVFSFSETGDAAQEMRAELKESVVSSIVGMSGPLTRKSAKGHSDLQEHMFAEDNQGRTGVVLALVWCTRRV